MRLARKFLTILLIIINHSYADFLDNFYKFLEHSSVIRMNINFSQTQFDRKYESFGDFFILGKRQYFYDSPDIKIHADSYNIVTKNYLNKQVVYNNLVVEGLNIFDILSGNRKYIEFLRDEAEFNKFNFLIPKQGFEGYFLFEPKSGYLKSIFIELDMNQTIIINISGFEILDSYIPKIELDDFEVIDLRG